MKLSVYIDPTNLIKVGLVNELVDARRKVNADRRDRIEKRRRRDVKVCIIYLIPLFILVIPRIIMKNVRLLLVEKM